MQFHTKCAVIKINVCSSSGKTAQFKACYEVTQGCKKEDSSKNGRFRHEMIGTTQPEIELKEMVTFIYPFRQK